MKTFKLMSLEIIEDEGFVQIPLEDGLIINKEDEQSTWIMEAYVGNQYGELFQTACSEDREIIAQVIISKKENDPAVFITKVCSVKQLQDHVSILLKGTLRKSRTHYAEHLLEHLLEQGFSGEQLLEEFKHKMVTKPKLPAKNV